MKENRNVIIFLFGLLLILISACSGASESENTTAIALSDKLPRRKQRGIRLLPFKFTQQAAGN